VGHDLQIFPWTIPPAEPGENPIFEIYVALMKPDSRGWLRLVSSDPAAAPVMELGYFTDPGDMPRRTPTRTWNRRSGPEWARISIQQEPAAWDQPPLPPL